MSKRFNFLQNRPTTSKPEKSNYKSSSKINDTNNNKTKTSQISSITDTKLEGKSSEEPEKILENLIIKYNKINDSDNNNNLNDYCMENHPKDFNFLEQITNVNKRFDDFVFTSPKEEGEKCQLVEKNIVDKCREENEDYTKSVNKLSKAVNDLKVKLFKAQGENNFVKQAAEYQNRLKSDNAKQLRHMETMLEECKLQNKLYREELTQKIIQKDSLMNALTTYISKYDKGMADELKNLVSIYNNQYYKVINMGYDEKYIDNLFSKIKVFERKIVSKNKEIKELEQYLLLPGDKNKNKNKGGNKQRPKTTRPNRVLRGNRNNNKVSIDAAAKSVKKAVGIKS